MTGGPDRWTVGPANRRRSTQRIAVPSASLSPETEITADPGGLRGQPPPALPLPSWVLGARRMAPGREAKGLLYTAEQVNLGSGSPWGTQVSGHSPSPFPQARVGGGIGHSGPRSLHPLPALKKRVLNYLVTLSLFGQAAKPKHLAPGQKARTGGQPPPTAGPGARHLPRDS